MPYQVTRVDVRPFPDAASVDGALSPDGHLDRTKLLLYRVGIIKESPVQTAPGTVTKAPKAP